MTYVWTYGVRKKRHLRHWQVYTGGGQKKVAIIENMANVV